MLPFLRAGRIVRHHFHTQKLVHQFQRERARLHTVLDGEPRLARFCPIGFGHPTGQARVAVLLTGGGPFDQFRRGLRRGFAVFENRFVICFGRSFR